MDFKGLMRVGNEWHHGQSWSFNYLLTELRRWPRGASVIHVQDIVRIRALFTPQLEINYNLYLWQRHSTKHGLDWTGQLDWTVGLDYWTGILFY